MHFVLRRGSLRFTLRSKRRLVPATGLEPVWCYPLEPESSASANSATRASRFYYAFLLHRQLDIDVVLVFVLELRHASKCHRKQSPRSAQNCQQRSTSCRKIQESLRQAQGSPASFRQRFSLCAGGGESLVFTRFVRWCNGNTAPFGGVIHGSNPCRTAKIPKKLAKAAVAARNWMLAFAAGFPISCSPMLVVVDNCAP